MHSRRKWYLILLAALMGAIFVFVTITGCAALRRPAEQEQVPQAPPGARQALPNDPRESAQLADRLAKEAASTPGVKRASVVLTGTTAYVGVNLDDKMEREQTERTQRAVGNRVKKAEPRIERVLVTTDTDMVTRLAEVAEGIRRGEPVSAFTRELGEINRRSTPIAE
jgi:YhcN/YlaJ family sporulation lipoprotein